MWLSTRTYSMPYYKRKPRYFVYAIRILKEFLLLYNI